MRSSETKTKAGRVDRLARQAADYVQGSRGPIPSHDELDPERIQRAQAEKKRLYDWAEENDLIIEAALKTDKGGFEHAVSFKPEKLLVIKETRTDKGFGGGLALNNKNAATVGEYLDRINIANEEFGSEIKLLGVRRTVQGPSIRTQMPFFKGGPAMLEDVAAAMESAGYQKIGDGAYFHPQKCLIVFDLYPKNAVILDGYIHPIDPVIMRATQEFVSELKTLYY